MTNINWIVRIKNKNFWLTIIPALLLLGAGCGGTLLGFPRLTWETWGTS